jgi:hypothetical protein
MDADKKCLGEALRHIRWAREDVGKGDLTAAFANLIAANRMHAMSHAHGTASWERVSCVLRNAQRKFWAVVRPLPMPAARGNA